MMDGQTDRNSDSKYHASLHCVANIASKFIKFTARFGCSLYRV